MFNKLEIMNFTAFEKAEFTFDSKLNIYAGGNGSGKTHILKLLYSIQKNLSLVSDPANREPFDVTLVSVFKPDKLGRLTRRKQGRTECSVEAIWSKRRVRFSFNNTTKTLELDGTEGNKAAPLPILIPAKDILGHSVNFVDAYETVTVGGQRWLDFDTTYPDLLYRANPDIPRGPMPDAQKPLLKTLRQAMNGTVTKSKSGRYYLRDASGSIEFPLLAEGWRKLGLLWILIRNGSLTDGSVLYWDEPESNLNPSMFPIIADILVKLAASGTQLHLASHSYAFIRELEHFAKGAELPVSIFGLEASNSGGTVVQKVNRFVDLDPNLILSEYEQLYQKTVMSALAERRGE